MKKNARVLPVGIIAGLAVTLPLAANAQLSVPPHMQQPYQAQPVQQAAPVEQVQQEPVPQQMMQQEAMPQQQMQPPAQTMPISMMVPQTGGQRCNTMQVQISHGITFMTGGTTQEDINQFSQMDPEFNLQLLFAAKNNDHLIVYRLRFLDEAGFELLSTQVAGPYFYAHIPAGSYQMEVTHEMGAMPVFVKMSIPDNGRVRKTILLQ